MTPRDPRTMPGPALAALVADIQAILWYEPDVAWNPDKEWQIETVEYIAAALAEKGLAPTEAAQALPDQTRRGV